jgi:hypothetical protein
VPMEKKIRSVSKQPRTTVVTTGVTGVVIESQRFTSPSSNGRSIYAESSTQQIR